MRAAKGLWVGRKALRPTQGREYVAQRASGRRWPEPNPKVRISHGTKSIPDRQNTMDKGQG